MKNLLSGTIPLYQNYVTTLLKRKGILLTVLMLFFFGFIYSQDIITKKSGEDIKAKILEVTNNEVKYKKYDSQTDVIFTLLKSDILMIRYSDGTKDIFNQNNVPVSDLCTQAKEDAQANYRERRTGATWTGLTAIITSPIWALIPAISCSSSQPKIKNLDIANPDLMKNSTYSNCYKEQAHKMKRKKIWKSYGVGSICWAIAVVVLVI